MLVLVVMIVILFKCLKVTDICRRLI